MNKVASYINATSLETDKKVNLVYGLNGAGKSILSGFLYDRTNSDYSYCMIEGLNDEEICVYSQKFIEDYFYEVDHLKGVFTLTKQNKEAEIKIKDAEKEIEGLTKEKLNEVEIVNKLTAELAQKKQNSENKTWEIKTSFAGGDRVLEYCLTGLMGMKASIFSHLLKTKKLELKPNKTTDQLKKEVEALQGSKVSPLPAIIFGVHTIESNPIFQKVIVGNENSTVAELIRKLNNSDWVKEGLSYIPDTIVGEAESCPFCQKETITQLVAGNIRDYFDKDYVNDISELKKLSGEYGIGINQIENKEAYESNPFIVEKRVEFENKYNVLLKALNENKRKIEEKLKTPSQKFLLSDVSPEVGDLNKFIQEINADIAVHNEKMEKKEVSLEGIKKQFWDVMRWEYDQTISAFENESKDIEGKIKAIQYQITNIDRNISSQNKVIAEQQRNTVNIDEAIKNINNGLLELGIESFRIGKHSDFLYRIVRGQEDVNVFKSLSEGEKMVISFLYFREFCKGKRNVSHGSKKKIVVIDDPISSLSHIYVFNIGQLIKCDFLRSSFYDQVFVFTHSLYFFYELADIDHDRREKTQKLFRMVKNNNGTQIIEMKYEEVQNDYQAYWQVIRDDKHPPALIANCMRNIVEYFFGFIEKRDINMVFQKPELQATKYQAFCRYINRESHSLGQNIFDYKEFNYADFKEALRLVFKESGYEKHYERMIK